MRKKRWTYYVGVEFNYHDKPSEIKFVTDIDNEHRVTYWKTGKVALAMSQSMAEGITEGLCMNGFKAFVIKAPSTFVFENEKNVEIEKDEA